MAQPYVTLRLTREAALAPEKNTGVLLRVAPDASVLAVLGLDEAAAVLRLAPEGGGQRLDLEGDWSAAALSELRGELHVCATAGSAVAAPAQAAAHAAHGHAPGAATPHPTPKMTAAAVLPLPPPLAEEAGSHGDGGDDGGAGGAAFAETLPAAKRSRHAAAPTPAAGQPKPQLPQPYATKQEAAHAAGGPAASRGGVPQLAGARAASAPHASSPPKPLLPPPPAVTLQVVRGGVVAATYHDAVRCLSQLRPRDVVHATGVHRGSTLVVNVRDIALLGWPWGAPKPPPGAKKLFTVLRRSGQALLLERAAHNCSLEGLGLCAADALVVEESVQGVRAWGCALVGPGRACARSGIGLQLRRGAAASVEHTTAAGFGLAGVAVCVDAQIHARRVAVSETAGAAFRLDGARASSLLQCTADGGGVFQPAAGATQTGFYINAAPSDLSGSQAIGCVEGFRCEFPSSHREPAAAAPARAKMGALIAAYDALKSTPHKACHIKSTGHETHGVVMAEGVAMDLTDAELTSCGGYGVRVCDGAEGFAAPITLRLKTLRGCGLGGVAFEAAAGGGDAVAAGRVQPASEAALLAAGCHAYNAGGNWLRNVTALPE